MNHSTAFDSFNTFIIKKHFELGFYVAIERKREYSQLQTDLTFGRVSYI